MLQRRGPLASRAATGQVPDPAGAIGCDLFESGFVLTPGEVAGKEHSFCQVALVIDPKMVVPPWLINLAVRNLAFMVMLELRKAVKVTRSPE